VGKNNSDGISIDSITQLEQRSTRATRLLLSAARIDNDHAATAATSWASAAEAASRGRLSLVREAYAQLSEQCRGKAWGVEV